MREHVVSHNPFRFCQGLRGARLVQVVVVERGDRVERDEVGVVVEVDVTGSGDDDEFLGAGCLGVDVVAEVAGVGVLAGDEQDGAWCDVVEVA